MQIYVRGNDADDLSRSSESVVRNLLFFAFTKSDSYVNGDANCTILCNSDNTWLLGTLFTHNYLWSTLLENLLYKKVMYSLQTKSIFQVNLNNLLIRHILSVIVNRMLRETGYIGNFKKMYQFLKSKYI